MTNVISDLVIKYKWLMIGYQGCDWLLRTIVIGYWEQLRLVIIFEKWCD